MSTSSWLSFSRVYIVNLLRRYFSLRKAKVFVGPWEITLRTKSRSIKYSRMSGMLKAGPDSPVLEFIFHGIIDRRYLTYCHHMTWIPDRRLCHQFQRSTDGTPVFHRPQTRNFPRHSRCGWAPPCSLYARLVMEASDRFSRVRRMILLGTVQLRRQCPAVDHKLRYALREVLQIHHHNLEDRPLVSASTWTYTYHEVHNISGEIEEVWIVRAWWGAQLLLNVLGVNRRVP